MKIYEILSEAGEYEKGQSFGKKLLSPSKWITPKSGGDYEKGAEFGQKLLSPSQWFKSNSNNDGTEDEPEDKKPEDKKSKPTTGSVNQDNARMIVKNIIAGQPKYPEDLDALSNLRSGVINGTVTVNVDSEQLSKALKTIIDNDPLTSDQVTVLKQYAGIN